MAGMINQLIEIMDEQAGRYQDLLGLSQEKKDVIIANDVEGLQKITHLENILISQNQKLERKRLALVNDIALVMNKKPSEMTLRSLADMMEGQKEQQLLLEVGKRVRTVLDSLSEINTHNASLIDNALDYIEYSLNVIRSTVDRDPGFYNPQAKPVQNRSRLFDAKN